MHPVAWNIGWLWLVVVVVDEYEDEEDHGDGGWDVNKGVFWNMLARPSDVQHQVIDVLANKNFETLSEEMTYQGGGVARSVMAALVAVGSVCSGSHLG